MSAPVLARQRNQSAPSAATSAPGDGRAIRGVIFGLLLAIPFWLVLAVLVMLAL